MSRLLRTMVAGATALAIMTSGVMAASLGVYQTTDRKMDYGLDTCGSGEKNLCVTLLAARGSAVTPNVTPYIGQLIVNQAKPRGKNKWSGKMRIGDYELSGQLKLNPGVNFVMSGCAYVVVCDDFTLIPAQ